MGKVDRISTPQHSRKFMELNHDPEIFQNFLVGQITENQAENVNQLYQLMF